MACRRSTQRTFHTGHWIVSTLYVNMTDIPGESVNSQYSGQIECMGMTHAVDLPVMSPRPNSRTARLMGNSNHGPVVLFHRLDNASPALREAVLHHANHLGDVEIDRVVVLSGNAVPVESIRLVNARLVRVDLVTVVDKETGEPGNSLIESFQLAYDEIVWTQRSYDDYGSPNGSVEGAWSIPLKTTTV